MLFNKVALLVLASAATFTSAFVTPTKFGLTQHRSSFITKIASEPTDAVEEPAAVDEVAAEPAAAAVEEVAAEPAMAVPAPKEQRLTMFIGNLSFETTDAEVRDMFLPFGKVELVSVPRNRDTGKSRGFAFVDMGSEEEREAAIADVDGTMVGGRTIRVNKSLPKDEVSKKSKKREIEEGCQKIYVGNIPFDTNKEELIEYYEQFGIVKEVYIPIDSASGGPRGFAFVTMAEEDAEKAISETDGAMYQGRTLAVSKPLPRGEKAPARALPSRTKLYVGNLSFYTELDTVQSLFEEYGQVFDCYMPIDRETGSSRGFAFVTMGPDDASSAMGDIDGYELDGRIIRVNEAQPKGAEPVDDYEDGSADGEYDSEESGEY